MAGLSHSSAVCVIPPRAVWEQVQEIRCFRCVETSSNMCSTVMSALALLLRHGTCLRTMAATADVALRQGQGICAVAAARQSLVPFH